MIFCSSTHNSYFLYHTEHLDHSDPHSFSKDDLHKLIVKATADLEELDKKRREEFKQYEMEKEFQYQESLKNMSDPDKQEAIKKHDEQLNKHKQHARLHAPGSKQQLEEVWQEQDHMPKEEFNPKTFFSLRDVNGDGVLDQEEVESMLSLEVRKLYDPNNPEDDPNEMMEEFHRMREQFYKEADKDHDGVITKKEFLDLTARADFEKDPGWKGLDENPVYTQQELHEYEKHRQQALEHQYAYYMPEYHGAPQQHHPGQFVPPPHAPPPVGYQQQGYIPQPPHPGYAGAPPPPQPYQAYPNQPYPQHPGYQPLQQQQTNYQAHQQPQPNYQAPNQQQPGYQGPNQQQPGYQPHPGNFQANPPAPQLAAQPNLQQNPNQPSLAAQYQQPSASQQYQQPPLNNPYPPQSNQAYPQQNVGYQQPSQAASNPAANSNQQNHPAAGQPVAQQVGSPPKH